MVDPKTGVNVKEYLNSFVEEYVNANFKHRGPKIMKKVAEKRERYRRNNHRNDDIYTREKAQGALRYTEDIKNTADTIDETIDLESAIDNNGDFYFWKEFDTED